MISYFTSYAQPILDRAYYALYGHELSATPKNLEWALEQKSEDILQYTFKDGYNTYSILEYSVKIQHTQAVTRLIELDADLEFSPSTGLGSILHFYMDCLKEDESPNLEILKLLLDNISGINIEEAGYFNTALECALEHMATYKKVHWDVIEILLERGVRITENVHTVQTPFTILRDSYQYKSTLHGALIVRTFEEEQIYLDCLVDYLALEKKYYPNTTSSLTLDEFKSLTSNLQSRFTNHAIFSDTSSVFADGFNSLLEDLKELDPAEKPDEILDFERSLASNLKEHQGTRINTGLSMMLTLRIYYKYFKSLVKEGTFKDCFETWQLTAMQENPILNKIMESMKLL